VKGKKKKKKQSSRSSRSNKQAMSAPAVPPSSAPPPQDAYPTNQTASPTSPFDSSEKPSHASSLAAGQEDADATTTPSKPSTFIFSKKWMLGPVVKDYGDYGLLACSFVTGMVDGASFLNWGVFVGMQTGEFCCFYFSGVWFDLWLDLLEVWFGRCRGRSINQSVHAFMHRCLINVEDDRCDRETLRPCPSTQQPTTQYTNTNPSQATQ